MYPKYYNPDTQQWETLPLGYEGLDGLSAYEIAVEHGFVGTEEEWLASLYVSLTAAEVKTLYESNENTNAFTDLYKLKVDTLWSTSDSFASYITAQDLSDYVNLTDLINYVTVQDLSDYITAEQLEGYIENVINPGIFTETDRLKLDSLWTKSQEEDVNPDWSVNTGPAAILNKPTLGTASAQDVEYFILASDNISADKLIDGTTNKTFTAAHKTKLDSIPSDAEKNVNADWDATSGDAQILNKPNLSSYALLASPTFTGIPAAPTATAGTNTTQIATTAFVQSAVSTQGGEANVNADWNADSGDAEILNKPDLTLKANLVSPTFTGIPAAPTATVGTNTTQIATTAFVQSSIPDVSTKANLASPTFTGTPTAPTAAYNTNTTQLATTAFVQKVQFPNYVTVASGVMDCSAGVYFYKSVSSNITFSFSNPYASGTVYSCTLEVAHNSGTISWDSSIKWPGGFAPLLTSNRTHIFTFVSINGGTTWRATALADYPL